MVGNISERRLPIRYAVAESAATGMRYLQGPNRKTGGLVLALLDAGKRPLAP